jgi:hypothetical protein
MRGNPTFIQGEWVATTHNNIIEVIYQLSSPYDQGVAFKETQPGQYAPPSLEPIDIMGLELSRIRVISTKGDLKDTRLNPTSNPPDSIRLMGITWNLSFDLGEWLWSTNQAEVLFFNYTSKIGYQMGLYGKKQGSRLHEKLEAYQLTTTKTRAAIAFIWDANKPAKL